MQHKRVLIATGGTGGHIFPALALAQQLRKVDPLIEILFLGGKLGENPFFPRDEFSFCSVESAPVTKKHFLKSLWHNFKGVFQSLRALRKFRPDVVVGFGSHHAFPVLAAAKMKGLPIVLYESNCLPGKVIRLFSRHARITAVHFPVTTTLLQGKSIEAAIPLREGYTKNFSSAEKARIGFGLDPARFTILVFGGSQGALSLNTDFATAILNLVDRTKSFQVIHFTGTDAVAEEMRHFYTDLGIRSYVRPFEKRMDLAWAACDIVFSRAGAVSIAEQIEFEVPGILVPYPYASELHQDKNAFYMSEVIKGAFTIKAEDCRPERIVNAIYEFVTEDQKKLKEMRKSIHEYKTSRNSRDLCSIVCEVAKLKVR